VPPETEQSAADTTGKVEAAMAETTIKQAASGLAILVVFLVCLSFVLAGSWIDQNKIGATVVLTVCFLGYVAQVVLDWQKHTA
jgi:hypothetical protein